MLGFSQNIIVAYLIFVTLHATWTHCNFAAQCQMARAVCGDAADITTGITLPRKRRSIRTSPFIFRGSTSFSEPIIFPKSGRQRYGLDAEEIPRGFIRQTYEPFIKKKRRMLKV
jgi:hypothetical protein